MQWQWQWPGSITASVPKPVDLKARLEKNLGYFLFIEFSLLGANIFILLGFM